MRRKVILYIDTSNTEQIKVALKIGNKYYKRVSRSRIQKAQAVLPLIDKLLKEKKIRLSDLTAIEVNQGPGSFTGLRVGITVANTLGWSLGIPVNGNVEKLVLPVYQ